MTDLAQQIHHLRKEGNLDEAWNLLETQSQSLNKELELKVAAAWLFYDFAKLADGELDLPVIKRYYEEYKALAIPPSEELLHQQFERFSYVDAPWAQIYIEAESQSRQGEHQEAIQLARQIADAYPEFNKNALFGWILWRCLKEQTTLEKPHSDRINELLDLYLELEMPRPSRLHSTFLRQVIKLVGKVDFHAYKFMYHWGWEHFRPQDLERYTDEKGLHYSLYEKAMHRYGKVLHQMLYKYRNNDFAKKELLRDLQRFYPMLEESIKEFPENPWMPKERDKLKPFWEQK